MEVAPMGWVQTANSVPFAGNCKRLGIDLCAAMFAIAPMPVSAHASDCLAGSEPTCLRNLPRVSVAERLRDGDKRSSTASLPRVGAFLAGTSFTGQKYGSGHKLQP
jgi:hypothetical protein